MTNIELINRELITKLRAALLRAAEESDYCYACDAHPSGGHAAGCPVVEPVIA